MIITFCGHSDFNMSTKYEPIMASFFDKLPKDTQIEFYLGGYGNFDSFAYSCAKKFKQANSHASLIFVSPYYPPSFCSKEYDSIIYPELENKPRKLAILLRNKFMIKQSDLVFAYVNKNYGGAYNALLVAKKLNKKIINLAEL